MPFFGFRMFWGSSKMPRFWNWRQTQHFGLQKKKDSNCIKIILYKYLYISLGICACEAPTRSGGHCPNGPALRSEHGAQITPQLGFWSNTQPFCGFTAFDGVNDQKLQRIDSGSILKPRVFKSSVSLLAESRRPGFMCNKSWSCIPLPSLTIWLYLTHLFHQPASSKGHHLLRSLHGPPWTSSSASAVPDAKAANVCSPQQNLSCRTPRQARVRAASAPSECMVPNTIAIIAMACTGENIPNINHRSFKITRKSPRNFEPTMSSLAASFSHERKIAKICLGGWGPGKCHYEFEQRYNEKKNLLSWSLLSLGEEYL